MPLIVLLIIQIEKTQKNIFILDQQFSVLLKESYPNKLDGDLESFVFTNVGRLLADKRFRIQGINFIASGSSIVFIDQENNVIHFPDCCTTFNLKQISQERPNLFHSAKYIMHLPQYLSYLVTGKVFSELSSISSHRCLWNFSDKCFCSWVAPYDLNKKVPPIVETRFVLRRSYHKFLGIGVGVSDRVATAIPYIQSCSEQFVLINIGEKSTSLNVFNPNIDKSSYGLISHEGNVMKAADIPFGIIYDEILEKMNAKFLKDDGYHDTIQYEPRIMISVYSKRVLGGIELYATDRILETLSFFENFEQAYHHFISILVKYQTESSRKVITHQTKKIFVEGKLSNNHLFMNMLALSFPAIELYGSFVENAAAIGAAMILNQQKKSFQVGNFTRYTPFISPKLPIQSTQRLA